MIAPSYVLAFVFMLSSSLLVWLLWHCRNIVLLRLAPRLLQEEQDSNRALTTIDVEAAMFGAPVMTRTAGTPQHVISKLPVFRYEAPTSSKDQDSGNGADVYPAAVECRKTAHDSTSSVAKGSWMSIWRLPAAEASQSAAAEASVDNPAVAVVAGRDPVPAAAPQDAAVADCVPGLWRSGDQQSSADQGPRRPPAGTEQQQQHLPGVNLLAGPQQVQEKLMLSATKLAEQEQQQQQPQQRSIEELHGPHVAQDEVRKDRALDPQQLQLQQPQQQEGGCARDGDQNCVICFADYVAGDLLKQLPCKHTYHAKCIDRWLHRNSTCPLCKTSVWTPSPTAVAATNTAAAASRRASMYSGWGGGAAAASASAPPAAAAAAVRGTTRLPATDPSAQPTSHHLVELQLQQRRSGSSSSRRSSIGSYGSSLVLWDGMLLNARGPAAASGAVTAAGAAIVRS